MARRRRVRALKSPAVTYARDSLAGWQVPVWGGQITQRANFSLALAEGEGAKEYAAQSNSADEIARLWLAIAKSVKAGRTYRAGLRRQFRDAGLRS